MIRQPTKVFFFPDNCYKKKWRLKFQSSEYHPKDGTGKIWWVQSMLLKNNCTKYQFTTGNWLGGQYALHTMLLEMMIL